MKHLDYTAYSGHVVELAFAVEFDRYLVEVEHVDEDASDLCMLNKKKKLNF